MVLFFILGVVLLGVGVALLAGGWSFSARGGTTGSLGQIESYGFAGNPTEQPPPNSSFLPTTAGRLGVLAERVLGVGERGIRLQLLSAGIHDVEPSTIIGYRVLLATGLSILWIYIAAVSGKSIAALVLGSILLGAIGWIAPVSFIKRRARHRIERIDRELPELIDLLVVTLEAGLSFLGSLHVAAARLEGPLGVELRLTLQEQRMGLTVNDALEGMLRRGETPALRTFVRSVVQGELLGTSTGQIMRNLAIEMRKRRRGQAEERAQKAPVKMLFPLIFLIFPAMFVVLLGPAVYSLAKTFGGG
jgi:tight adherence protein C